MPTPTRLVVENLVARDLRVGDTIIKIGTRQGRSFPFQVYTVTRALEREVAELLGGTAIEGGA